MIHAINPDQPSQRPLASPAPFLDPAFPVQKHPRSRYPDHLAMRTLFNWKPEGERNSWFVLLTTDGEKAVSGSSKAQERAKQDHCQ